MNWPKIFSDWLLIPAVVFFAWAWHHGWGWVAAGWIIFWITLAIRDEFRDRAIDRAIRQRVHHLLRP